MELLYGFVSFLKNKILNIVFGIIIGLFIGAVLGSIVDNIFGFKILSKSLHSPIAVEFYIMKIEIQLTPASLVGMVVTGYLVIRKG